MSILLSETSLLSSHSADESPPGLKPSGSYELAIQDPTGRNRGYKRSLNLRHGLNLLIRDYWLEDELIEENLPELSGRTLEFGFNMIVEEDSTFESIPHSPKSFLLHEQNLTVSDTQAWTLKGRILKVDLHLTTLPNYQYFSPDQLKIIPAEVQDLIAQRDEFCYEPPETIAPNVQLVLQQILNCPYTGSIKQIYLEGKALELIALQSAQLLQSYPPSPQPHLKRSDIDRIHQARAIVTQQLDAPPSLLELARIVKLNDCDLKRGFRQVFGTTVFGYVRQQRLIKARQLLQETEMTVTEVTHAVGYAHSSYFAAAFKREFGVNPKTFQNSVW